MVNNMVNFFVIHIIAKNYNNINLYLCTVTNRKIYPTISQQK
jgi:hypothetical protein